MKLGPFFSLKRQNYNKFGHMNRSAIYFESRDNSW